MISRCAFSLPLVVISHGSGTDFCKGVSSGVFVAKHATVSCSRLCSFHRRCRLHRCPELGGGRRMRSGTVSDQSQRLGSTAGCFVSASVDFRGQLRRKDHQYDEMATCLDLLQRRRMSLYISKSNDSDKNALVLHNDRTASSKCTPTRTAIRTS